MENKLKIGDVVELEVYGEECCEICNEIIHNHIDCPVCEDSYAGTDIYCDLDEIKKLICKNCETIYELVSEHRYYECRAKIVFLKTELYY